MLKNFKKVLRKASFIPAILRLRRAGVLVGRNVQIFGSVHFDRKHGSRIELCEGVILNSDPNKNTLEARGPVILKTVNSTATVIIGRDSGLTSATVSAAREIIIGQRVLIGAGVLITDSDHHVVVPPAGAQRRYLGFPTSKKEDRVHIGDDVFIGARSVILKGVVIGEGSVIGAGSVVSSNIPPGVIAAGNPCRVIRTISDGTGERC